jgi:hypothetical protein
MEEDPKKELNKYKKAITVVKASLEKVIFTKSFLSFLKNGNLFF